MSDLDLGLADPWVDSVPGAPINNLLYCLAWFQYVPFLSPSQEEASRDQADRKGSEDMEGSEAEMAAEEGNIYLLCLGK